MKHTRSTIRLLAVAVAVGLIGFTATASGALLSLHRSACHTEHADCTPNHENDSLPEHQHNPCQICLVLKSLIDNCLNNTVVKAGFSLEPVPTGETYTAITTGCFIPRPVIPRGPPKA